MADQDAASCCELPSVEVGGGPSRDQGSHGGFLSGWENGSCHGRQTDQWTHGRLPRFDDDSVTRISVAAEVPVSKTIPAHSELRRPPDGAPRLADPVPAKVAIGDRESSWALGRLKRG